MFRSGFIMKPLMQAAKANPKRVIYAEGEDERVLRAVQTIVEEGIAKPILIGRPEVIDMRLDRFSLSASIPMKSRAIAIMSRPILSLLDGTESRLRRRAP